MTRFTQSLGTATGRQRIAALLLILALTALGIRCLREHARLDIAMENTDVSSETKRLASDLIFSKMTALAQTTIGLIGATWALLIMSDTRVQLGNLWSSLLFLVTNAFFLVSLWSYDQGYDRIASWIFDHGAFDIHAPLVSFALGWQRTMFLWGCLSLSAMILLWRRK